MRKLVMLIAMALMAMVSAYGTHRVMGNVDSVKVLGGIFSNELIDADKYDSVYGYSKGDQTEQNHLVSAIENALQNAEQIYKDEYKAIFELYYLPQNEINTILRLKKAGDEAMGLILRNLRTNYVIKSFMTSEDQQGVVESFVEIYVPKVDFQVELKDKIDKAMKEFYEEQAVVKAVHKVF